MRELAPTLPLLIPGVGAQGGDAAATVQAGWRGGMDATTGACAAKAFSIVNSSRAILYASSGADSAAAARQAALATRDTLRAAQQAVLQTLAQKLSLSDSGQGIGQCSLAGRVLQDCA